jgi:hypothetical protein
MKDQLLLDGSSGVGMSCNFVVEENHINIFGAIGIFEICLTRFYDSQILHNYFGLRFLMKMQQFKGGKGKFKSELKNNSGKYTKAVSTQLQQLNCIH